MNLPRAVRRWRMCTRKRHAFKRKSQAAKHARQASMRLWVYQCPICDK